MTQEKFDPYADIVIPRTIKVEIGKHTLGPWKILGKDWTIRSNEIKNSTQMADYQGSIICSLMEAHGNREHALAEAEANARLIAAAPELLEACKEMVSVQGREGHAEYLLALDNIERAIAKAEEIE